MRIAMINKTGGGMSGGVQKYVRYMVPRVAAHPDIEALLCASVPAIPVHHWFALLQEPPLANVMFTTCQPYRIVGKQQDPHLHEQLRLFHPDVIYLPLERFFRFQNVPVVNMVHNMLPLVKVGRQGHPFSERLKMLVQAIDAKRTLRQSDRIIANSEFVRDFLQQTWQISAKKIGLAYNGVEPPDDVQALRPASVPDAWKGTFFFSAGTIRPYRGLEDSIRALARLSVYAGQNARLVIGGAAPPTMLKYQQRLKRLSQRSGAAPHICWAGHLTAQEMSWCYHHCAAFIMSSRVEACPNIALEAMAHGCVSLAADNPPLPEIFGNTALVYPSGDDRTLADLMLRLLKWDHPRRHEISERTKQRARQFSWDECAEKTIAELAQVIRRKKP